MSSKSLKADTQILSAYGEATWLGVAFQGDKETASSVASSPSPVVLADWEFAIFCRRMRVTTDSSPSRRPEVARSADGSGACPEIRLVILNTSSATDGSVGWSVPDAAPE